MENMEGLEGLEDLGNIGIGEINPLEYLQRTGADYSELADLTGYSYDTVRRWFMAGKGRRKPPTAVLRLLAAELELRKYRSQSKAGTIAWLTKATIR